jgi:hypothetical protein
MRKESLESESEIVPLNETVLSQLIWAGKTVELMSSAGGEEAGRPNIKTTVKSMELPAGTVRFCQENARPPGPSEAEVSDVWAQRETLSRLAKSNVSTSVTHGDPRRTKVNDKTFRDIVKPDEPGNAAKSTNVEPSIAASARAAKLATLETFAQFVSRHVITKMSLRMNNGWKLAVTERWWSGRTKYDSLDNPSTIRQFVNELRSCEEDDEPV